MFDSFWNPLQQPKEVSTSWNNLQVTAPVNWRIFKRNKFNPIIMTVSGFPLNQIEIHNPKFKKSCFVTNPEAERVNMITVQSNYKTCIQEQLNHYTINDIKTSPYRHQGLEGVKSVSKLLPKDDGIPLILEEYIVIDNATQRIASLKFFAAEDIYYEKYLPDFHKVVKSLVIKSVAK